MRSISWILMMFVCSQLAAQKKLAIEVYPDSLLANDPFEITIMAENLENGHIPPLPETKGLELIAGPNHSQSISIINGSKKSSQKFTYFVVAPEPETIRIKSLKLKDGDETLKTEALNLTIHPNPDGIKRSLSKTKETFDIFEDFEGLPMLPREAPKKRRKVTRL